MFRLKSVPSSYSLSEYTKLVHDIQTLEDELRWLRESTKTSVMESWKEVERLHCQSRRECKYHVKIEMQLKSELKRSREEVESWRVRCLAAEERAQLLSEQDSMLPVIKSTLVVDESMCPSYSQPDANHQNADEPSCLAIDEDAQRYIETKVQLYSTDDLSISEKIWQWSNRNLKDTNKLGRGEETQVHGPTRQRKIARPSEAANFIKDKCSLLSGNHSRMKKKVHCQVQVAHMRQQLKQSRSLSTTDNTSHQNSCNVIAEVLSQNMSESKKWNKNDPNRNTLPQDLLLTISSREKIITSLEQTLDQYLKCMRNMQLEMECSIETHRIKEKKIASMYTLKEERLKRVIGFLRTDVGRGKCGKIDHSIDPRSYIVTCVSI